MINTEAAGLRLAIYARVSTEEQREGQTIDSQISELERFAREKAWVVAGTYKDDGWSGAVMAQHILDYVVVGAIEDVLMDPSSLWRV